MTLGEPLSRRNVSELSSVPETAVAGISVATRCRLNTSSIFGGPAVQRPIFSGDEEGSAALVADARARVAPTLVPMPIPTASATTAAPTPRQPQSTLPRRLGRVRELSTVTEPTGTPSTEPVQIPPGEWPWSPETRVFGVAAEAAACVRRERLRGFRSVPS